MKQHSVLANCKLLKITCVTIAFLSVDLITHAQMVGTPYIPADFQKPDQPGVITGPTSVCPSGKTQTYSVTAVPDATSYTWTLPANWTAENLTTTTSSITVTPVWVSGAVEKNIADPTADTSSTSGQITVKTANASGSSSASSLDVTTYNGCCAYSATGGYLKFMCFNLGADESLDPFAYNSVNDTTSYDIKGWLFQWGRPADGHQYRSSATTTTYFTTNTPGSPLFVATMDSPFNWNSNTNDSQLWNLGTEDVPVKNIANDPCPSGWRIPTRTEWNNIFRGGIDRGEPSSATANTWTSIGTWSNSPYNGGYKVGNALYLPAAGNRSLNDGSLQYVGYSGYYWSSATYFTWSVYYLGFQSNSVDPGYGNEDDYPIDFRTNGRSVRCIAQ